MNDFRSQFTYTYTYDLLVTKLHAYGISLNVATFIYSYPKRRKQNVKIHVFSSFQTL